MTAQPAGHSQPDEHQFAALRARPKLYFSTGSYSDSEMLGLLSQDLMESGAPPFSYWRSGPWHFLASPVDWLAGDESAFYLLLRPANGPQYAFRPFILLTAYAQGVATAAGGVLGFSHGDPLGRTERETLISLPGRVVAWLSDPSDGAADAELIELRAAADSARRKTDQYFVARAG